MKTSTMQEVVGKNIKPYEDLLARRGFLFKEDEEPRYELLRWFELVLRTNENEVVPNHIDFMAENGLRLYDEIARHGFKEE
jgi:hypothetical protein